VVDSSAGGVESNAITYEIIRGTVDQLVTVSEPEIKSSMLEAVMTHHQIIEGAAGVAIAGFNAVKAKLRIKRLF